jgi:hypothetical protein
MSTDGKWEVYFQNSKICFFYSINNKQRLNVDYLKILSDRSSNFSSKNSNFICINHFSSYCNIHIHQSRVKSTWNRVQLLKKGIQNWERR